MIDRTDRTRSLKKFSDVTYEVEDDNGKKHVTQINRTKKIRIRTSNDKTNTSQAKVGHALKKPKVVETKANGDKEKAVEKKTRQNKKKRKAGRPKKTEIRNGKSRDVVKVVETKERDLPKATNILLGKFEF